MEDNDGGDDIGSGELYKSFEEMENVYDKLQILNYEMEFLKLTNLPPLHRLYFIAPTNPGEQYFNFVSLSSWLIQQCKRKIEMPQESEDPNTVICRILEIVREMGAVLDFSPSRVKSGCGSDVVSVLDFLTDKAILKTGHEWESAIIPTDKDSEIEDDPDKKHLITLDKIEDEIQVSSSSDGEAVDLEDKNQVSSLQNSTTKIDYMKIINSEITTEQWQLELEKVLPQLKLTIKSDNFDWRKRLSQMQTLTDKLDETVGEIETPIQKAMSEVETNIEAVGNRETYLSSQFADRLADLHEIEMQILEIREKSEMQEKELKIKTRLLTNTEDQIRECQRQLDECGLLISDGAPVAEARKNLAALKREIADMNVEIAVRENFRFRSKDEGNIIRIDDLDSNDELN